jgi:rare lipoprotein A
MRLNNKVLVLAVLLAGGGRAYAHAPQPIDAQRQSPGAANGPMIRGIESPRAQMPVSSIDQNVPADLPQGSGPRGTSGELRYDTVGYASVQNYRPTGAFAAATITIAHATLPVGSFVELTSLDSGRTIVAVVGAQSYDGAAFTLSPGAAQLLGVGDHAAVRVRLLTPSGPDQLALRSGRSAAPRIDAPEGLLKALRKRLPDEMVLTPPPARRMPPVTRRPPVPRPAPAPEPGARYTPPPETANAARSFGRFMVQVAAFSTRDRAQIAARQVGGRIVVAGSVFRVQLGPFPDATSAKRARDEAARHGYGDARVIHIE